MNIFVNIGACFLGSALGYWVRPKDFWAYAWGIATMLSLAFALTLGGPWYLLGIPFFGWLLLQRRQRLAA